MKNNLLFAVVALMLNQAALATPSARTVMVHLFEWKWNDVAQECTNYLGPKGFSAVQVSPPNEHAIVEGFPWYQRYQPVSYQLESRSGNRAEFINMVKTCKEAGVDIYVDAVINHMTGVVAPGQAKQGSAGSPFSHFKYNDYSYQDFHHCNRNGDDQIHNYGDRYEVQNCALVNLADLDTEATYVQNRLSQYLLDLVNIGVAGFRIDAAKHMPTDSIHKILKDLPASTYVFQEVIDQGGEAIQAPEYFQNGDVTEFKYSVDLSRVLQGGKLAWLNDKAQFGEGWSFMPSDRAVVFVDNHDNQRGHGGGGHILNYKDKTTYEIASNLMLAWPYGYPQVMSSYVFHDGSQGPPSNAHGTTDDVNCLNESSVPTAQAGWVCEHRWANVAAMTEFRNITSTAFYISNWWSNGNNQIAFGRGSLGFIAINNENAELNEYIQTSLPAGKYCDVLSADCSNVIEVYQDGKALFKVKPYSTSAIHVGRLK